jgi:hypothetical protein
MRNILVCTATVAFGTILCAVLSFLVPLLQHGSLSRDFRPQAFTMGALIVGLSFALRCRFRWRVIDVVLGLLVVEFMALSIIGYFSGSTWLHLFHPFNLRWLAFMNLFMGLPWLLGFGFGSLWLIYSKRHSQSAG